LSALACKDGPRSTCSGRVEARMSVFITSGLYTIPCLNLIPYLIDYKRDYMRFCGRPCQRSLVGFVYLFHIPSCVVQRIELQPTINNGFFILGTTIAFNCKRSTGLTTDNNSGGGAINPDVSAT
jgi:hypothetical protein